MGSISELISQREAIDKQIAELRQKARTEAVGKVRALISEFDLTQEDIFGGGRGVRGSNKVTSPRGKVPAKYRDPVSGSEWTGRGMTPKWLAGRDKAEFLIETGKNL